jgi:DNA-binding beta-propeller fold protein YncE
MRTRTLLLSAAATLGALALLAAVAARRDAPAAGNAATAANAVAAGDAATSGNPAAAGNAAAAGNPAATGNATVAGCAVRGPIPLDRPVTAADRAAVPLAFQGNVVVSVAWSDHLTIIDLATGQQRSVDSGIDAPHELAVSPDGRWAVAADFGDHLGDYAFSGTELGVYELPSGRLVRRIDVGPHRGAHDIVFTAPTRVAVTTQTTRHVVEADITTGSVLGATETRAKGSHTLAVTADARLAFTANQAEGSLSRLDLANRRFLSKHVVGRGETEGIATTPDGREVWMGFGDMDAVLVVDGSTGAVLDTLTGFDMPERLAMSADGRYAAITDFACETVQVADVRTRRLLGPIAGLEGAGVAKILPDNRTAVILLLDERVVAMADLVTRRVVARHPLSGRRPDAAAWGPAR